ncbi:hypothetical protein LA345_12855 [Burkholderia vietnamiensis]|uniref:Filamentous haemagglutinin FhaB/tRNA nuclease CdiA-like TPS domain-containing protein n=1 Tax=Burkholderia vietnamiensis (strain G4 / LMG 22486) TaxID=269482 RepID=A4JFI8_BURVG|nr:hypothetical protein Bcep1808_2039 [Burkholderia vietnamiensis G4]MCB4344801.1 hypothetical protein [Burkholderia vietnamiensis]
MFSLSLLLNHVRRIVRIRRRSVAPAKQMRSRGSQRAPSSPFAFSRRTKLYVIRTLIVTLAAPFIVPGVAAAAGALPSGLQTVYGRATTSSTGNAVNVNLYTPLVIGNWNGGTSLGAGNSWTFTNMSGATKVLSVNIDTSGARGNINGAITAGGPGETSLLFVNPFGYSIGSSAAVNATGAVAFAAGTVQLKQRANGQAPQVQTLLNNAPVVVAPGASLHGAGSMPIGPNEQVSMSAAGPKATVPAMAGSFNAMLSGPNTTFELANSALSGNQLSIATDGALNIVNSTVSAGSKLALTGSALTISGSKLTSGANSLVELGGGQHGQDASLANANTTSIDSTTSITSGPNSQDFVWSQQKTIFNGLITNPGGNAEVSSAQELDVGNSATFNLRNTKTGAVGDLTFDPNLLDVTPGGTGTVAGSTYATGGYSTISGAVVSAALANANVLLQGITGIQVDDLIIGGLGTSLTLASGGSISLTSNANVKLNGGNFLATINDGNAPAGAVGSNAFGYNGPVFAMAGGASVETGTGSFTVSVGNYGGQTIGASVFYSGATVNAGDISVTGVGLPRSMSNSVTSTGITVAGGTNGVATLTATGPGGIVLTGSGNPTNGGDGIDLQTGTAAGALSNAPAVQTTTGLFTATGTGGALQGLPGAGVAIGSNGVSNTVQAGGDAQITGSNPTGVGVELLGGSVYAAGNLTVSGTGAGGMTNAMLQQNSASGQGVFANQLATLTAGKALTLNGDTAALFDSSLNAQTIVGGFTGGVNLSGNGNASGPGANAENASSAQWTAGGLQTHGAVFNTANTSLASTGDLLVDGTQFTGNANVAATGELSFGQATSTGSLGQTSPNSPAATTATGTLTGSGSQVFVEEDLSAQNIGLASQNSTVIGSATPAANLPNGEPTVHAGDSLSLIVDAKNTNTGNYDTSSVLDNYGTATSTTGNYAIQLAAPTGVGTETVTVNPVVQSSLPADNDPNVAHPDSTWQAYTPPSAQTGTVELANNHLGNLAPLETSAMQAPGSSAYYNPSVGRTVYNEPASVVPAAQTYLPGVWVPNQTTTPPSNGGGTTTPPSSGGGTTTPPSNPGGGETTPPSNPGNGNTTPPVTPPTTPTVPTQPTTTTEPTLPAVVPPTTIVATPTTTTPTLQGNTLFVPSANTPVAAGATLSLPSVAIPTDASSSSTDDTRKAR